jgi:hypothetical protein
MTSTLSARIGLACAVAALLTGTGVRAEEGVAIKNLLGNMGIVSPERDTIRYRERAPLVLPPKMDLRQPSAGGGLAATNPAWPKDPDVEAKNRRASEERKPVTLSETRRMSDNNPRLSVDELRAGRDPSAKSAIDPKLHRGDNARDVLLLSPDEMRAKKTSPDDGAKLAGDEPERRSLAEPPTGMRKPALGRPVQASSAPRVDQQAQDANPINWLTRKFSSENED